MRPDFNGILARGRRYNFHTHTQFCDGRNSVAEMAAAAAEAGLEHVGFTPHSPICIESPCNMSAADVPLYFREVDEANARHEGQCRFYKGMEIDYLGPEHNAASPYYTDLGLDFSISSVHFIPAQNGALIDIDGHYDRFARNLAEHFHNNLRYVVSTYFEQSMAMLAIGGFDILGHFDKIAQNASYDQPDIEQQGWYNDLLDAYVSEIIKSGKIVEINTKARIQHGRFFPHERLWPRLIEGGVRLMVNSDAHYADRLDMSRGEAFAILDAI